MTVRVLDSKVISRIAAGEVVERPASVVKELVENSLDATSTQISVEVRGGGVNLIRMVDNGMGIPAVEVALAFDRHATSKISRFEDLELISSLGFRGEALPSIAAVAQVDVVTRAVDESAGSYLTVRDGMAIDQGSKGRSRLWFGDSPQYAEGRGWGGGMGKRSITAGNRYDRLTIGKPRQSGLSQLLCQSTLDK